jgi:D-serine deaminase-like pyridoxal phosphate-dependent protein
MSVIVDSGLHRFGLEPSEAANLAYQISSFSNINFIGFSTHPGHVYKKTHEFVEQIAKEECDSLVLAKKELLSLGIETKFLTTGSTPTVLMAVNCEDIDIIHPGNYVFNDFIQISLKAANEEDCALTVMASVVSNPEDGIFIIDAGAKCLGLDKGAHGNSAISGYGYIKGHPDACVTSLSEEVGIVSVKQGQLSIGDVITIIPNHSCSTANLTSRLYCLEDDTYIVVDIRGNSYNF